MDWIHPDYNKMRKIIDDVHEKYNDSGLIQDLVEKDRFGLSKGLQYTHVKRKPRVVVPTVDELKAKEEEEEEV